MFCRVLLPIVLLYVLGCHAQMKAKDCYLNTHAPSQYVYSAEIGGENCLNDEVLDEYAVCEGKCNSHSRYADDTGTITGYCTCCLPSTAKNITVTLYCSTTNRRFQKVVQVPTGCRCQANCTQNKMPSPALPDAVWYLGRLNYTWYYRTNMQTRLQEVVLHPEEEGTEAEDCTGTLIYYTTVHCDRKFQKPFRANI